MFIDDPTGALSASAAANIQAAQQDAVFDVKVTISTTDTRGALDAKVSGMVTSANTLAIGVDPIHHFTFTHFGIGTGIPRDRYQDVARAGNGEFKQGHWEAGINAIVANATAARHVSNATTTIVVPTQQTTVEHPFPVLPLVGAGLALTLGFFLLWRWNRRKTAEVTATLGDFRDEANQLRSRNIEEQAWHDKMKQKRAGAGAAGPTRTAIRRSRRARAANPGATPVIVQGNIGNDLLTGMLIGEAISRPSPAPSYSPPSHSSSSSDSSSSSWSSSDYSGGSGGGDFGGGFDGGGSGGSF